VGFRRRDNRAQLPRIADDLTIFAALIARGLGNAVSERTLVGKMPPRDAFRRIERIQRMRRCILDWH